MDIRDMLTRAVYSARKEVESASSAIGEATAQPKPDAHTFSIMDSIEQSVTQTRDEIRNPFLDVNFADAFTVDQPISDHRKMTIDQPYARFATDVPKDIGNKEIDIALSD